MSIVKENNCHYARESVDWRDTRNEWYQLQIQIQVKGDRTHNYVTS